MTEPLDTRALYENLDTVAAAMPYGDEELATVIAELAGLVWQDGTHERDGAWLLDPDAATASRGVAHRWLRDHGYLPRR